MCALRLLTKRSDIAWTTGQHLLRPPVSRAKNKKRTTGSGKERMENSRVDGEKTNASRFARTNAASRSVSAVYTSGRQQCIIILCTRTLPRSSQSNVHQLARRTRCPNTAAADRADSGTRVARCSCTNGRYFYLMTAVITEITIAIRGR